MRYPYYLWWVYDYNSDPMVLGMTDNQDLAYRRMLDTSWDIGALPFDEKKIATLIRFSHAKFKRVWNFPLTECWKRTKDGFINTRMEDVRYDAAIRYERSVRAGKASGIVRRAIRDEKKKELALNASSIKFEQNRPRVEPTKDLSINSGIPSSSHSSSSDPPLLFPGEQPSKKLGKKMRRDATNRKKSTDSIPAGEKSWRGKTITWEQYAAGISWSKEKAEVEISDQALTGLREHLQFIAKEEGLRMLTAPEMQEGWGRLNTHLISETRKRGPKTLPGILRGWLLSDLRKYGRLHNKNFEPRGFQAIREASAEMEEEEKNGK